MPRNPFLDQVPPQEFPLTSYYLQSKLRETSVSSSFASSSISASYASSSTSASYAFNATSASYALTASFAMNAGGNAFPYTGSAQITGSLGVTGSSEVSLGVFRVTNVLANSVLDTSNSTLSDSTGNASVLWANYQLSNTGITRVDWNANTLADSTSVTSVDWENKRMYDSLTSQSVDWNNRILYDPSSNTSINYDRRQAIDSATNLSIDWENRRLQDNVGNVVLDWQNRTFDGTSSLATLATSASYIVGGNNTNYPVAVFNGPTGVDDSGSFIIGGTSRPLYFNPGFGILTTNTFSGSLTGTASFATTASYVDTLSQSVLITGSLVVTGSIRGQVIDITPNNQTASLNCASGNMFTLTLSSSVNTVLTASNIQPGQAINLRIVQPNPSGSLSYGSQFKFSSGFAYTASTTSSVTDIVSFLTFDTSSLFGTSIRNFV